MPSHTLRAVVLSHLPFEDLGSLEPELKRRHFVIEVVDMATAATQLPQVAGCDLLVVLGGPIGVYESQDYPFLADEIRYLRDRLDARRPALGICLGAQLMAAALGASVYPGARGPEIGWLPLRPPAGNPPIPEWFAPLLDPGLRVLHWHGDTFDLPAGATLLASTERYPNQAFSIGRSALALQFHPEILRHGLERWYVGHTCEIRQKDISIQKLRGDTALYAPALEQAAAAFWRDWLDYIL